MLRVGPWPGPYLVNIQENFPLAPLTTLEIGGPARYFVRAESENDVFDAIAFARKRNLKVFVLGGGSNVLISDRGFDGLVVQVTVTGIFRRENDIGAKVAITAGAGEDWDQFVAYCVENDLAGVECLSGIPGFVGGTPVQNVGAYGQEVSETITAVRCFDREAGDFIDLTNEGCGFTYRRSIFNSTLRERYVVLSVTYELTRGGSAKVEYNDLLQYFAGRWPTLAETREAVLHIRRQKSMLIDPVDPNSRSAGSFFKNPVVMWSKYDEIARSYQNVPHFEFGTMVKIPAAWLIEKAGFEKGSRLGRVGLSTRHTLALVNLGGATAQEMIVLRDRIQIAVLAEFGIALEQEPVLLGF